MIAYIPMRWYTIYADGRTERQQKESKEKEMYKQIIHTTKSAETLDGIIRAAMEVIENEKRILSISL